MRATMRDEQGVAMITAVLISFAVLLLSVAAVGLAVHNSEESGENRERTQAIATAEAGINRYYLELEEAAEGDVPCGITGSLNSPQGAEYTVTAVFEDPTGNEVECDALNPSAEYEVTITSTGRIGELGPERTMESRVDLSPQAGSGAFGTNAIFAENDLHLDSNTQTAGIEGKPADLYSNGNITLDSNTIVDGNVFPQGTFAMASNSEVKRDVHSGGTITLDGNSIIRGDATASVGSADIDLFNQARISGDAQAAGSITDCTKVGGSCIQGTSSAPPPAESFPSFSFDASVWEDEYSVHDFSDCGAAKSFVDGIASGDHVIRINSTCQLSWSTGTVDVQGDLAIVTNGDVLLRSNVQFRPVDGPHTLHFFTGVGSSPVCTRGFAMSSNSTIEAGLETLVHTPCGIVLDSNSDLEQAQLFGYSVEFNSRSGFVASLPISVPGIVPVGGWSVEVQSIREVSGS